MDFWFQCNKQSRIIDCSLNAPRFYHVSRDGILLRYAVDLFTMKRWKEITKIIEETGSFVSRNELVYRASLGRRMRYAVSVVANDQGYIITIFSEGFESGV